ncbi:MAG: glycosyltransferase family 9 protein [Capsulimonas sp.]|uniref:glycosyltransferase family 9 protein n=1 Tax=Capsulimonas sp. TaxID=2494211 RepID=UPI003266C4E6
MKRILITKMWALGDILMATPILRALRREYPGCHITWLVERQYAELLQGTPFIDEVIAFDSASWRRYYRYGQIIPYLKVSTQLRRRLNAAKYDISINLTAEKWWSLWFNAAPIRIGLFPRRREGLIGRVYTKTIPRTGDPWLHNTEHYLLAAAALGISAPFEKQMVVGITPEDHKSADDFLSASDGYDPSKPVLLLHPGTSQDSKCWPAAHFAKVADAMADRFNIVVTGSPGERALAQSVADSAKVAHPLVAAGALPNVRQTAALVDRAAVVVTGDTSILHIASALDTPMIGIYGSTRPKDNAPLFGRNVLLYDDTVPCSPCYKSSCPLKGEDFMRCMTQISPAKVLECVENALSKDSL